MTEQELFEFEISKKSAFTLDRGVVISAPNQIYFYDRKTDYIGPEEEGEEEVTPINGADFDYKNYVAPEGFYLIQVNNLRGGSVQFNDSLVVSESFGILVNEDEVRYATFDLNNTLDSLVDPDAGSMEPTKEGHVFLGTSHFQDGEVIVSTAIFDDVKTSGTIDITIDWSIIDPGKESHSPTETTLDLSLSDDQLLEFISSLLDTEHSVINATQTNFADMDTYVRFIRSLISGDHLLVEYTDNSVA